MPEGSVAARCPGCGRPVFDGCNVVRCSRCEALLHQECWERRRACAARAGCRGKPQPVIVVRLPQELDAAELYALAGKAAADHVADVALPRLEARVESRSSAEALAAAVASLGARVAELERTLGESIVAEAARTRDALERLRARVDAATATIRALGASGAASTQSATDAFRAEMDERFAELERRTAAFVGATREGIESTAQSLHEKLDATHFAVDRARRPFPWDDGDAAQTGRSGT